MSVGIYAHLSVLCECVYMSMCVCVCEWHMSVCVYECWSVCIQVLEGVSGTVCVFVCVSIAACECVLMSM